MNDRPTGQRFTLAYLSQSDPTDDSKTMRYRLGKLFENDKYHPREYSSATRKTRPNDARLRQVLEEEIGQQFATFVEGRASYNWIRYSNKLSLHKLLDAVTIYYRASSEAGRQEDFIAQVNRIFREENVAYEVDEAGGVHPIVDGAYASTKQAAIRGLGEPRYALSLLRVNEVDAALMASPTNYIQAIRAVFGANENLFKMMFGMPRLDTRSANDQIGRKIQSIYELNPTMQRSGNQILKSFSAWIDAAHYYRHEEGAEEPSQPAEELAIVLISEGMSFVRWLAAIDKKMQGLA